MTAAWRCLRTIIVAVTCAFGYGTATTAQEPAKAQTGPGIESDPIQCWWRTDKTAVHVGQQFTLTLTCRVVETATLKVVPDLTQLEPTAVQLSPFEVVGGVRHDDIRIPRWRYLQREYVLRVFGDGFFGRDIDIPSISLGYHVESTIGGGTPGRDQTYALPALPIRIVSLVPKNASDIRDGSRETFGDIEARLSYATTALVAAGVLFVFAAALLAIAVWRLFGRRRDRSPAVGRPLPPGAVLRRCGRALKELKADVARAGWTPELAGRALAVLRVAGAVSTGRPIAQTPADVTVPPREGQLVVRRRIRRPRRWLVSASTTAAAIAAKLAQGQALSARRRATLEQIQYSMHVFSAFRYRSDTQPDGVALDAELDRSASAIGRLGLAMRWPFGGAEAFGRITAGLRAIVWSR